MRCFICYYIGKYRVLKLFHKLSYFIVPYFIILKFYGVHVFLPRPYTAAFTGGDKEQNNDESLKLKLTYHSICDKTNAHPLFSLERITTVL